MDIKELRKLTGLSQSKFAKQYHINLWTLQNWERGKGKPSDVVLYLLERIIREVDYKAHFTIEKGEKLNEI